MSHETTTTEVFGRTYYHYRGYRIHHDPPPIPDRSCDWHYEHDDFGGDGDKRYGHSPSLEYAKADIDEQIEEGEQK